MYAFEAVLNLNFYYDILLLLENENPCDVRRRSMIVESTPITRGSIFGFACGQLKRIPPLDQGSRTPC